MSAERFMRRALELARLGVQSSFPNPRVGAVIVKDERIVGEGYHHKAGEAHAEINALMKAGDNAQGATCYVTLEPCNHYGRTGPCSEALLNAGIKEVIYAIEDPNPQVAGAGVKRLEDAGVKVSGGMLADEAYLLNRHFFHRIRTHRPWFSVKLAMSIDGRTALANKQSQWITGEKARLDVHRWRSEFQAILTGIGTVRSDDPRLTVRGIEVERQPTRIIVDAWLDAPIGSHVFNDDAEVLVLCAKQAASERVSALKSKGVTVLNRFDVNERKRLNLAEVARVLGEHEINSVWMECGSHLASAFMDEGLIDELIVYVGNTVIGKDGSPLLQQQSPLNMNDLARFRLEDVERFDNDVRMRYVPIGGKD